MKTFIRAFAAILAITAGSTSAQAAQRLEIRVLSSPRPDLVSGGDALVEVAGAGGPVSLTVNGAPSTSLQPDPERGSLVGLVEGLKPGANALVARAGRATARLTLTNHSKDGPILSGPHIWPYECRTDRSGLGPALDSMCNAPTKVEWFYRASDGTFKPLPAGPRPADIKTTTTIDGRTVPYVVRVEGGTINRTIYRIALLDDPQARDGGTWKPGAGWNRRLAVSFGGGLAGRYEQGANPARNVLNDLYLSRGFAFMNASGLVNGLASNAVIQGETLMMLKEHFIERYGLPRWTVGFGGSGGAIQQLNITALYPGLLDGLQPEVGFADSQIATQTLDCDLFQNYWKVAGPSWTDDKKAAAMGVATPAFCKNVAQLIAPSLKPNNKAACGLNDRSLAYDAVANPKGARCGIYAWLVNQLGRDPKTGIPLSPLDNVGVQYGLSALNEGKVSFEEFLDLNERIGGFTADGDYAPRRTAGDATALRRVYASGLVNPGGGGLGMVPIISYRNYGDPLGDIHDRQRDFEVRLRLIRANGDAENQVIWVGPMGRSLMEPSKVSLHAPVLDAMTQWLDAIAADPAPRSHAKVVRMRPAGVADAWIDENGEKHLEPATMEGRGRFNTLYPVHQNPRIVAGGPPTNDVLKCQLKPLSLADYKVSLTPEQAGRLRRIFPAGVCDFRRPGVGQVAQAGTYQDFSAGPAR